MLLSFYFNVEAEQQRMATGLHRPTEAAAEQGLPMNWQPASWPNHPVIPIPSVFMWVWPERQKTTQ